MIARAMRSGPHVVLAIHGGAGTISRADMKPRREMQYRRGLERALQAGYKVLAAGGASLDAVMAAVIVLEDDPLFNAGRGAVFNAAGTHELDAAIMDGATRRAGAVAGIRRAKNPICVARAVMEKTEHVLLAGTGADRFARAQKFLLVPPEYFSTRSRLTALKRVRQRILDRALRAPSGAEKHGTVGAVALDRNGNLAAATSTGGYTNKMSGRVGDSPIIGAGTYADNESCAVSATGQGEVFMRAVLAYDVSARMRYLHEPVEVAACRALARVAALDGTGGLIALDRRGRVAMPCNTEGMYRGSVQSDGALTIELFR